MPPECATVWDEAAKDACFERAAREAIAAAPVAWLARAPAKLATTFDYFGAAPWYLHASDAAAFGDDAKVALGTVETIASRLLLVAALVACALAGGPVRAARAACSARGRGHRVHCDTVGPRTSCSSRSPRCSGAGRGRAGRSRCPSRLV